MLRKTKVVMMYTVSLWGLLGALHNVIDWQGTLGAVGAVTSMATIEGGADRWQATNSTVLIWLGALFIMGSKVLTGVLCGIGATNMWRERASDSLAFDAAKKMALSGCAVAMIMLFGGFIVIAEGWFELWRSESMVVSVLDAAFRYGAMITLIGVFVASRD